MLRWVGVTFIAAVIFMFILGAFKNNIYDSRQGMNLLVISKEGMGVVGIRPSENLVNFLVLPNNLMIDVGVGDYQVEGLWKVGLPGRNGLSGIRLGVGRTLGVDLAGVIKTSGGLSLAELIESITSLSSVTNLSLIDRAKILSDLSGLLKRRVQLELTLPSGTMEVVEEPDGKKIFKVNNLMYSWAKRQWVSDQIMSETAEVFVINASGKEGLAREISRQLETAGIRVIEIIASGDTIDGGCVLFGRGNSLPKTTAYLRSSFGCHMGSESEMDKIDSIVKSDIVMLLGKDDAKY